MKEENTIEAQTLTDLEQSEHTLQRKFEVEVFSSITDELVRYDFIDTNESYIKFLPKLHIVVNGACLFYFRQKYIPTHCCLAYNTNQKPKNCH